MKKRLTLLAAILLVAMLVLSGCTGTPDPTAAPTATSTAKPYTPGQYKFSLPEENYDFGGKTIVIYSYHGQDFEQREDFIRRYALDDEIKSKYNVNIRYDLDMTRGANDAIAGSPTIDVGFLGLHTLFSFYNGGAVEPLDDYFTELHFDGTNSIRWDAEGTIWNTMGGKVYAMNTTAYELWKFHNVYALFMNKDLLVQRGINPNEIYDLQKNKQWTWDKFSEYAQRVTYDLNHDDVNDIWGTAINGDYLLTGLMTSARTNYIQYNKEKNQFTYAPDDAFLSTLTFIKSLITNEASRPPETISGISENVDIQDFMDGKLGFYAYVFQRTWQAGFFGEMKDDYGVLCFPMPEGQNDYYIADNLNGGWAMYTHPNKDDCRELAKFLYVYCTPRFDVNDPTDEQEAYWTEALNRIRDEESRYFLEIIYDQTNVIRNNNTTFNYNGLMGQMGLHNIWDGSMSVQEAIQTTLPVCQEFMETFYSKTGL
ncbi:MAG: extracellular solute-binding protein [Eubacteriales bacterium]|nr:extracellular solute-binding protein [Eubacteriales bacterium]